MQNAKRLIVGSIVSSVALSVAIGSLLGCGQQVNGNRASGYGAPERSMDVECEEHDVSG